MVSGVSDGVREASSGQSCKRKAKHRPEDCSRKSPVTDECHKHGLTAETIVIGDEDPRAFDRLRAELEEEYNPRPGIESELVERIAVLNGVCAVYPCSRLR